MTIENRLFDEIQPGVLGLLQSVCRLHDALVAAFLIDQLHLAGADLAIGARPVLRGGDGRFHGTANGRIS